MDVLERLEVDSQALAAVATRHNLVRIEVFGSAARDELRPDSDVDVIVAFAADARPTLYDFVRIQDDLAELFGRNVDVMEDGFVLNPYRRETIERDRRTVYAA